MNRYLIPISISLLAVAIIFSSLTSSGLIKGTNQSKQHAEVKGEAVVVISEIPIPTITPSPTIEVRINPTVYEQPAAIPTPTPTIQNDQSPYLDFQDKQAYCRNLATQAVQKLTNDPEMKKDLQSIQGELGSDVTKYLYDSTYSNAYQNCLNQL